MIRVLTLVCLATVCLAHPYLDSSKDERAEASISDYPYHASLRKASAFACSAVIINPQWLLTTAFCASGLATTMSVRVGSNTHINEGLIHAIDSKLLHPDYNSASSDNDIALLKVSSPFIFTTTVKAATLPTQGQAVTNGSAGVLTGWGNAAGLDNAQRNLQVGTQPIATVGDCQADYGVSAITGNMICADAPESGLKTDCASDDGGPMIVDGVLMGLTTWGGNCPDFAVITTKVSNYVDWINANAV